MNIFIDKKLEPNFITEAEVLAYLKGGTEVIVVHRGVEIIISTDGELEKAIVERHDGKRIKHYNKMN